MPSKILCLERSGLKATLIEIEVDTRQGLPHFHIVGLPDTAIEEAKQRVESAIKNCGLPYPRGKIIVNLAPAHVHKIGTHYDLAIALGILAEMGLMKKPLLETLIPLGELALEGSIRPILGALVLSSEAKKRGIKTVMLPAKNCAESSLISGLELLPVNHLMEAVAYGSGQPLQIYQPAPQQSPTEIQGIPFEINGQGPAKRAIEIAAAGHHSLLLWGPPGTGKTQLAKSLIHLMPPLNEEEKLEVLQIQSIMDIERPEAGLPSLRPFRTIHPRASMISLTGGGSKLRPGELSLAHRGVLLMDEFLEFPISTLESLRQPLEEKRVLISRHRGTVEYPAEALVVGTFNPCPCGYFEIPGFTCTCTANQVQQYQKKLSGPLLDRIDLMAKTLPAEFKEEKNKKPWKISKENILKAREIQKDRFQNKSKTNAGMDAKDLKTYCALKDKTRDAFYAMAEQEKISWRSLEKILKVGRTLADLDGSTTLEISHLMEAFMTRPRPIKK